jgi:hypothetical protein
MGHEGTCPPLQTMLPVAFGSVEELIHIDTNVLPRCFVYLSVALYFFFFFVCAFQPFPGDYLFSQTIVDTNRKMKPL